MNARPLVSILIVTWNTRELTLRCLDSIPGSLDARIDYEVIIVDNGSIDGTATALGTRRDLRVIENAHNLGFAAAVNQAYRSSSGELVLLLNSDIELDPGSLQVLVTFLSERSDVAGVGPIYRNPDGSPQPFHFRFPTFAMTLANGSAFLRRLPGAKRRLREYRMLDDDFSRPRPVPQPSASCLLLRRSVLPAERIFDERYPIFFNDVMLARSLADAGHALWVVPEATTIHEAHASTSMLGGAVKRQYLGALVRMLSETEPAYRVWLYRILVFTQGLGLYVSRRPDALAPTELWKTLAGDPGRLPGEPAT